MQIRRLHHGGGPCELLVDIAGVDQKRVARRLLVPQVLVKVVVVRQIDAGRPGGFQLVGRLNRLPGLLGHDPDEVALDDDLHQPGDAADRAFVDLLQSRTDRGRTHHPAVEHPRQPDVVDELELAGRQRGHVDARDRRAEHCPVSSRLAPSGAA